MADLRPRRAKRARTAGGGSNVSRESEESIHVTWPSWAGHRHRKYAVIAVNARKVERLMGYWQGRGYPQKGNTKGDAAEAACIVAAAQRKGQGLLLIVQDTDLDEYDDRTEDREERYYERYGKYPFGVSDMDEDPDDSDDEYLWQLQFCHPICATPAKCFAGGSALRPLIMLNTNFRLPLIPCKACCSPCEMHARHCTWS
jgi:hypothetical protein